jgi:PAS domain S-box-containing protein
MGVQDKRNAVYEPDASGLQDMPRSRLSTGIKKTWDRLIHFLDGFGQYHGRYTPVLGLLITVSGIILAHTLTMILVYINIDLPYYFLTILDTTILILTIIPLLYLFSLRPLLLQVKQRQQAEGILQARMRLMEHANHYSLSEYLVFALDEIEALTGSDIGFFHFLNDDQNTVTLQAWSTNTTQKICNAEGKGSHYDLQNAGVWADAIRLRKPTVHNQYSQMANRRGLPSGHARIIREIVVPIMRDNQVVGILGLGNKAKDYTQSDVDLVSTYADFAWDIVEHKQADQAVLKSEEKFRTLVDWTYDWEIWVDLEGNMVYVSPSCERITGYKPEEFIANPRLMIDIIHPDDRQMMEEHQKVIHDTSSEALTLGFCFITKDGQVKWIEHICRPLFDAQGQHLGRRISNRDVTERKLAEQMIDEQNKREQALTRTLHNLQTDIGRDLHDTLGNQISFLRMSLEHLSEIQWTDPVYMREQLHRLTQAANESYEMVRAMLAVLQSDELEDPLSLFTRYAEKIADRSSMQCEVSSQGTPRQLTLHQIRQLFYIYREALGNIEKYARAKNVTSRFIWKGQDMNLVISDDGVGFDPASVPAAGHYGLKFIRQRAALMKGSIQIQATPGKGTTITVVVPYDPEAEIQLV